MTAKLTINIITNDKKLYKCSSRWLKTYSRTLRDILNDVISTGLSDNTIDINLSSSDWELFRRYVDFHDYEDEIFTDDDKLRLIKICDYLQCPYSWFDIESFDLYVELIDINDKPCAEYTISEFINLTKNGDEFLNKIGEENLNFVRKKNDETISDTYEIEYYVQGVEYTHIRKYNNYAIEVKYEIVLSWRYYIGSDLIFRVNACDPNLTSTTNCNDFGCSSDFYGDLYLNTCDSCRDICKKNFINRLQSEKTNNLFIYKEERAFGRYNGGGIYGMITIEYDNPSYRIILLDSEEMEICSFSIPIKFNKKFLECLSQMFDLKDFHIFY